MEKLKRLAELFRELVNNATNNGEKDIDCPECDEEIKVQYDDEFITIKAGNTCLGITDFGLSNHLDLEIYNGASIKIPLEETVPLGDPESQDIEALENMVTVALPKLEMLYDTLEKAIANKHCSIHRWRRYQ